MTNIFDKHPKKKQAYSVKAGDRVALVYPNADPLNFLCAFYGCVFAGAVPVPIEVPITRRVSSLNLGFTCGDSRQVK